MLDFRHRSSGLISRRWPRITFWMLSYSLLQFALQLLCLRFLGETTLSTVEVFAGFAFGRLLSTIPITPSGVGFADTGAVASLVAFGGDPAICTAGVLLFTGFIFLLEIPVGGVVVDRLGPHEELAPAPGFDPAAGLLGCRPPRLPPWRPRTSPSTTPTARCGSTRPGPTASPVPAARPVARSS